MHKFVALLLTLFTIKGNLAGWDIYRPRLATKSMIYIDSNGHKRINSMGTLKSCKYEICTYVDDYPKNEIDEAMDRHHTAQSLLGDILDSSDFSLEDRGKFDDSSTSQLCSTEGFITYKPQGLRNFKNEWKFVVNTDSYHQTFTVEICRDLATGTSGQCHATGSDCSTLGYTCVQNYQNISLLVYDDERIRFDKFTIPTTCKCCDDEKCRRN